MSRFPYLAGAVAAVTSAVATVTAVSASTNSERIFSTKAAPVVTSTASYAGIVGIAGLGVAGGLLLGKHYRLAAVTAAASAASLAASRGYLWGRQPKDTDRPLNPDDVRLYVHNVLCTNDNGKSLGKELTSWNPDVIVLIEATREITDGADPALRLYPHTWSWNVKPGIDPQGVLIASKYPLADIRLLDDCGFPSVSGQLDVRGKKVRLIAVHTDAPTTPDRAVNWRRQISNLTVSLDWVTEPYVLMVGDFNATVGHAPFRGLLRVAGLTDITGSMTTWPTHLKGFPAVLGLDHVLTRGNISPLRVRRGSASGSDHVPVIADIRLQ